MTTTLSVKVSGVFATKYRKFCDTHCLQIGKFTEQALIEIMEDHHFGLKAQAAISRSTQPAITHTVFMCPKIP